MGLDPARVIVTDIAGVVYAGRTEEMDPYKARFAADTPHRTLEQALEGADIFLGLSAGGVLQAPWLTSMAERPLILALANPTPQILPGAARAVRPDAIVATGRTDYPNQVNNVLCFPFLFRGALDCGASEINGAMKRAAVQAIAGLAREQASDIVRRAYGGADLRFGADYLIPKPFDPRLMDHVAPAVARAAMESGVATRPIEDLDAYRQTLQHRVFFRTGMTMKTGALDQCARPAVQPGGLRGGRAGQGACRSPNRRWSQGIARPDPDRAPARGGAADRGARAGDSAGARTSNSWIPRTIPITRSSTWTPSSSAPSGAASPRRGAGRACAATRPPWLPPLLRIGEADAMICGIVGGYQGHLQQVEQDHRSGQRGANGWRP